MKMCSHDMLQYYVRLVYVTYLILNHFLGEYPQ